MDLKFEMEITEENLSSFLEGIKNAVISTFPSTELESNLEELIDDFRKFERRGISIQILEDNIREIEKKTIKRLNKFNDIYDMFFSAVFSILKFKKTEKILPIIEEYEGVK